MPLIGYCVWTPGPQLEELFGKPIEFLEGGYLHKRIWSLNAGQCFALPPLCSVFPEYRCSVTSQLLLLPLCLFVCSMPVPLWQAVSLRNTEKMLEPFRGSQYSVKVITKTCSILCLEACGLTSGPEKVGLPSFRKNGSWEISRCQKQS